MVRFLAGKGANLEAQTNVGLRPIHIAAGIGHRDSAEAFIEFRVDVDARGDGKVCLRLPRVKAKMNLRSGLNR